MVKNKSTCKYALQVHNRTERSIMKAIIEIKVTISKLNNTIDYTLFINDVPIQKFSSLESADLAKSAYENNSSKLSWVLNSICKDDKRIGAFLLNNDFLDDRFEIWLKNQHHTSSDRQTLRAIFDAMDNCDK